VSNPTTGTVSAQVRYGAVAAVLVVAAVAAVLSYGHLQAVAAREGEAHAWLFPLSVDGLIVAASLVLLVRRRSGQPGGPLAWGGLALGVAATVAGNIASAEPTAAARVIAAWPPVAFALSYELLLALIRPASQGAARPDPNITESPQLGAAGGLEERARELIDAAGPRPVGRRALARQLGVSEHQARTVLAAMNHNGTRPGSAVSGQES